MTNVGTPTSSLSSSLGSLTERSFTNVRKEQDAEQILNKLEKAQDRGRFTFVDKRGEVRTTGKLKTWLIRHFSPGFAARQHEKVAEAFHRALIRCDDTDYERITEKFSELTGIDHAVDDSEQIDGPSISVVSPTHDPVKFNIMSVFKALQGLRPFTIAAREAAKEAAKEAAQVARQNEELVEGIDHKRPGTYIFGLTKSTLESAENSLNGYGHNQAIWTSETGSSLPYTPKSNAEIPFQFGRDAPGFDYHLDTVGGLQTFEAKTVNDVIQEGGGNNVEAVFQGLKSVASKAGAKSEAECSKAAQALSTLGTQAIFGGMCDICQKHMFDGSLLEGQYPFLMIDPGRTSFVTDITVLNENEVKVTVSIKSGISGFIANLNDDSAYNPLRFGAEDRVEASDVIEFRLSTVDLLKGDTKVVPGSLMIKREVNVEVDANSVSLEEAASSNASTVDNGDSLPSSLLARLNEVTRLAVGDQPEDYDDQRDKLFSQSFRSRKATVEEDISSRLTRSMRLPLRTG